MGIRSARSALWRRLIGGGLLSRPTRTTGGSGIRPDAYMPSDAAASAVAPLRSALGVRNDCSGAAAVRVDVWPSSGASAAAGGLNADLTVAARVAAIAAYSAAAVVLLDLAGGVASADPAQPERGGSGGGAGSGAGAAQYVSNEHTVR